METLTPLGLIALLVASSGLLGGLIQAWRDQRNATRAASDRYAAARLRLEAQRDRADAERLLEVWEASWHSSEHAAMGKRLADHCDRMQAERDEARRGVAYCQRRHSCTDCEHTKAALVRAQSDANDWEQVATLLQSELDEERKHGEDASAFVQWVFNTDGTASL